MNASFERRSLLRAALLVTGSTYFTYATGLLISMLMARHLRPAEYGRYSYVVWLSGVLVMLSNNGLTTSSIRFVSEQIGSGAADNAARLHGLFFRWQRYSIALASILFLAVIAQCLPSGWQLGLPFFGIVVLTSAAAKSMYLSYASVAKGYGRFDIEPKTSNILSLITLLATAGAVLMSAHLDAYLAIFAIASVGYAIVIRMLTSLAGLTPESGAIPGALRDRVRKHLAWTIALASIAALTNKSVETFLLNRWVGPESVGFFLIAAGLTRGGIELLTSGLNSVLMPSMSHAYGGGDMERVRAITSEAVRYFVFLGVFLAGAAAYAALPIVLAAYGPQYGPAVLALQVMAVVGGLTMWDGVFGALLSITDHQHLRVGVAAAYLVSTGALALALIPRFGFPGALAAHASSRLIVSFFVATIVTRRMKIELPITQLGKLALAAIVAAAAGLGVVTVIPTLVGWALACVTYVTVYVVGSVITGFWSIRDLRPIEHLLHKLPWGHRLVAMLARYFA